MDFVISVLLIIILGSFYAYAVVDFAGEIDLDAINAIEGVIKTRVIKN